VNRLIIIVIAALVSTPVYAAGRNDPGPCRVDAKKFCGGRVQGVGATCLSSNLDKLTQQCKAAVLAGEK
jgi:hypothetical protein